MSKKSLAITISIAVVVGALSFYGGMQYQNSQRASFFQSNGQRAMNGNYQQRGYFRQGNGNGMGRPVSGEITSVDSNSVTVKTQDGSSKIIVYSEATKINKASEGSPSDLKVGERIMAIGTEGSDGTVTAQNISLGNNLFIGNRLVQPTIQPTK